MNDLPTPNLPLLRKAVEWAEAEAAKTDAPCLWDQSWYAELREDCGTVYCIAGYAVMTSVPGAQMVEMDSPWPRLEVNGEGESWYESGRDALGLTDDEADALFDDTNDIIDVRRLAEEIAARAGERL